MQQLKQDTPEREPTPSEVAQVTDLLGGKSDERKPEQQAEEETPELELEQLDEQEEEHEEPDPETDERGAPTSLADLAERLGIEVEDLYAIEIPFGDNAEPKKLGELKDGFAAVESLSADRLQWEETKAQQEREIRKHQQDIADIVSILPKAALTPEVLGKITRHRDEVAQREERLTKAIIPDWKNPEREKADRQLMSGFLSEFGFPENYLDALVDSKTLAMIRDSALRKKRVDDALAQVRQVKETGHRRSTKPGKPNPAAPGKGRRAERSRSVKTETQAVVDLLSGKGN